MKIFLYLLNWILWICQFCKNQFTFFCRQHFFRLSAHTQLTMTLQFLLQIHTHTHSTHANTHTHTHTHTHTQHTRKYTYTPNLSFSHTQALSLSLTHTHSSTLTHTPILSQTHTISFSFTHTRVFFLSFSLTRARTLTHRRQQDTWNVCNQKVNLKKTDFSSLMKKVWKFEFDALINTQEGLYFTLAHENKHDGKNLD